MWRDWCKVQAVFLFKSSLFCKIQDLSWIFTWFRECNNRFLLKPEWNNFEPFDIVEFSSTCYPIIFLANSLQVSLPPPHKKKEERNPHWKVLSCAVLIIEAREGNVVYSFIWHLFIFNTCDLSFSIFRG